MATDAHGQNAMRAPGTGTRSEAPVDLAHLRRFTLGDRRLEREVLTLFIEHAPVSIAAMRAALTDRDWTNAAHSLKGSARAVGAWRIATLAERAEQLGQRCDAPGTDGTGRAL